MTDSFFVRAKLGCTFVDANALVVVFGHHCFLVLQKQGTYNLGNAACTSDITLFELSDHKDHTKV